MFQTLRTLLIVDDSPEDRELYRRYLLRDRDYAYTILEASLGQQGLELWQQHKPDAVLLDYRLPDLDGLEFLAQLKLLTEQPCLPVIMVTGQGNEAIAVQSMKAGAQDYLVKEQITPEGLHLAVNGVIETVQLRTQLQQRIERERLVAQITQKIHQSLDLQEILQTAVTEVRQFLQTDRVVIFRLQPNGEGTVITESVGNGWTALLSTSLYDPCFNKEYAEAFRQGHVTVKTDIYDGSIAPCHVELLTNLQVRANLVVPILQDRQLWGMVIAHHCAAPRHWQPLEIDLLKELATQLGVALQQGELYQQTQNELAERRRVESELRESEERFRQLAENINAVLWAREAPEGRVSYVSSAYERLWGLNPQEVYEDPQTWVGYIHPDDREAIERAFQEKAAIGQFDEEYRIGLTDGSIRWVRDRCFPLRDGSGTIYRFTGIAEDITVRKQAELERLRSDAILQAFIAASPLGLVLFDRELRFLYINEALAQINGLQPSEHLGRTLWEVLPQMAPQVAPMLLQIMETQEPILNLEFNGEVSPGVFRHTIANHYPVCLPNGEVIGVGVAVIDVNDLTQAQEELRESEQRFRTLADNISQFAWMADENGSLFWYNQRWFDYTGTTLEDMQGWGWQKVHHPDHIERVVNKFRQCVETGETWEDTFPLRGQDGQYRWFLSRAIPVRDEQGKVLRWFGTNTDITERQQAEEKLQKNAEQLQGLTTAALAINSALSLEEVLKVITDQAALIIGAHQAVTSMTIDQNWAQSITSVYLSDKYAQWRGYDAKSDGSGIYASVCHLNRPMRMTQAELEAHPLWKGLGQESGKHPPMRGWLAAPLMARDGRNMGLIQLSDKYEGEFTASDESILVQLAQMASVAVENARLYAAEQQARAAAESAREAAERANRIKDEFLAVLSHELRSPLNPILGWAKLLQTRQFDAAKTAEALATIERNARLQTQLVDDLLDVAKILRGKLSLTIEPVDLSFVVEAAIETVRTAAIAKSISLHAELPDVGQVAGDAARLQQIFWNLLSNAIKFTPDGGQVSIRLEKTKGNGGSGIGREPQQESMSDNPLPIVSYAQLTVRDTGKGIKSDFLPHIFESFRQEDASTTRKYGGLGLGLAIVRQVVEAHGGTITADSPGEGLGATFTVRLPLMKVEPEPRQRQTVFDQEPNFTGIRVLIVDDEPDALELLVVLLNQYGADVMTATSGAEVLSQLASFRPDVLISDIGMPDMDGYSLIQAIRSLQPEQGGQIPAIALTAYAREEDHQQAIASGYQWHIAKPLEPAQLVQAVIALTRHKLDP